MTRNLFPRLLPLLFAAGCGVDPNALPELQDDSDRGANAGFTWDTTKLTAIPAGSIPAGRLGLAAFDTNTVARMLINTNEDFVQVQSAGGRIEMDSASFHHSSHLARGLVLAVSKLPEGPASAQDEAALQSRALQRLQGWGIGSGELGAVWQRRLVGAGEESGVRGAPARLAYKTFVNRAVLGVPVAGHRAVVTHGLDGSFRRALVKWPALAAAGHLLHTQLTTSQIKTRATQLLGANRYTSGKVRLRWKYLATEGESGEAVLKLVVGARIVGPVDGDVAGEPEELDVDVSAVK